MSVCFHIIKLRDNISNIILLIYITLYVKYKDLKNNCVKILLSKNKKYHQKTVFRFHN